MKRKTFLAGVEIMDAGPVRVMAVINVSPESFFKDSIESQKSIRKKARKLEEEGADFIDVGAMSTAPYLKTQISEKEETERIAWAVKLVRKSTKLPISIDTSRWKPAVAGLNAGAAILNDISGLHNDARLNSVLRQFEGVILMAHPRNKHSPLSPRKEVESLLQESLRKATLHIEKNRIVLDPGIGFFRNQKLPWWKRDISILKNLKALKKWGYPLLVGVSRKSFIGHILGGKPTEERLWGSLAATVLSIQYGANIIRTHDVAATKDAIEVLRGFANEVADDVQT